MTSLSDLEPKCLAWVDLAGCLSFNNGIEGPDYFQEISFEGFLLRDFFQEILLQGFRELSRNYSCTKVEWLMVELHGNKIRTS